MTTKAVSLSKSLIRASAVLVVAMSAGACSTVPDWVDPTTWIGGSDDQTPAPDQNAQTADNNSAVAPDLSTIPDKPAAPSTPDDQKQVADSLATDRDKAQYSGDALRGGTEPSAAPPPASAPATEEVAANDSNAAPPPSQPEPPPPPAAGPGTLPADNAAPPQQPAPAAQPSAAETQVASTPIAPPTPTPSAMPAVPAVPGVVENPSDAALGFRPSSAPPLDATVAQFVPPSILARYQQTAAIGPQPAVPSTTYDNSVMAMNGSQTKKTHHKAEMGMGGPEKMSGAVVANFDALQGGSVGPSMAAPALPGGPQAVVFFPHDTTVLTGAALEQVRATAKAFLAQGGQGYVKIVGHSSSRAGSMSAERQLVWNFERSQARAKAVARALIHAGVPADRVLVQAAGDDQPVYQGEDGSRRAEIFFQS